MSHPLPTSVTQGTQFATAYPFANPSDDVRGLLTDLYLSVEKVTAAPLSVAWLHGFGTQPSSPPSGAPTPVHAREILVKDSMGATAFDSTLADDYEELAWGDRLVLTWRGDDAVCRVVVQAIDASAWPAELAPDRGQLDARTWHALPKRVTAVLADSASYSGSLELAEGYNVGLTVDAPAADDGGRNVTSITVEATPGLGLGVKPGCADDSEVLVRRINGVGPDPAGNFVLDATDCFRVQIPATSVGPTKHRSSTYGGHGIDGDDAMHGLVLSNDCTPCCECDDYRRTYLGLKGAWNAWKKAAEALEKARDRYADNKSRWNKYRACVLQNNGRLVVIPELTRWQVGGSYCNTSTCCLQNLEIRFTLATYCDGVLMRPDEYDARAKTAEIEGSVTQGLRPYQMWGSGRTLSAFYDKADPQELSLVRFILCLTAAPKQWRHCVNITGKIWMTVHVHEPRVCVLPDKTAELPADLLDVWHGLDSVSTDDLSAGETVRYWTEQDILFGQGDRRQTGYGCEVC